MKMTRARARRLQRAYELARIRHRQMVPLVTVTAPWSPDAAQQKERDARIARQHKIKQSEPETLIPDRLD